MGELKHFFHKHKLILNEVESVVGKDVECAACRQPINKLIDAFYRCNTSLDGSSSSSDCAGFFMHKTCSEFPSTLTYPNIPDPLTLVAFPYRKLYYNKCSACGGSSQGFMYGSEYDIIGICLKCVTFELKSLEDRRRCHPGHKHPLTLVQSPAFFLCHACNTTATDLSYICTKCCFYIHKSCANAPITYQCKFHNEHPLILNFSLPQEYGEFASYCSICSKYINPIHWVYYCANCRFFAHMKCASLTEMLSDDDEADSGESNLMHFPAHDETSLNKMMQQCIIKATDDETLLYKMMQQHVIKATYAVLHNSVTAGPSPYINHWSHTHQLALRNKNEKTSILDSNQKLEDTELLICDGCTKPISMVDDIFYECSSCNFFLHRSCAQFPKKMEHHLAGKMNGALVASQQVPEVAATNCQGCYGFGNGIFMFNETACRLDIRCASLPRKIKHEGHRHTLNQLKYPDDNFCKACVRESTSEGIAAIMYGCEKCEFYIHIKCALRPYQVKHRWDPHPLYLILSVKNVPDHPHSFDCEVCSEQIDPTGWFYHCNACDLSFHMHCFDPYYWFSTVKLPATKVYSDTHPHFHGFTWVLNKKKRRCKICGEDALGVPVLQCSPCKYIVHACCFFKKGN